MGQWGTMAKSLICNCCALCRSVGQYGGVHVSDPQEQLQWGILPRCVRSPYRELPVSTTGMHSVSTEHFLKIDKIKCDPILLLWLRELRIPMHLISVH